MLSNSINNLKIKWETEPYTHAIIDDFLPPETFSKIVNNLDILGDLRDVKKRFSNYIESNKEVYGDKDLNELLKLPINILGGVMVKEQFQKLFNIDEITSLTDEPNYGGYYPFHVMGKGGLLGAHVDHSHSFGGKLHVANSIYYASPKWEESWGGETMLLNNLGTKIIKKILFKPNRLILFAHSAKSFHAVNTINCPENIKRMTYYMDYYTNDKNINKLKNHLKNSAYSYHLTTFVPFFPLGLKSFKFKYFFKKSSYEYLRIFFRYLVFRFVFNYKISKFLKNILLFFKKKSQ